MYAIIATGGKQYKVSEGDVNYKYKELFYINVKYNLIII